MPKSTKKKGKGGKSKAEEAAKLAQLEAERKALLQALKSNYYSTARSFLREPLPPIISSIDQAITRGEPASKILLAKLTLTVGDLWAFTTTFAPFSELTSLRFSLVKFDDRMLGILAHFIQAHPPLDTLSIIACSLGPSIADIFADALPSSGIINLTFDYNSIEQGWPTLFHSISKSKVQKLSCISTSLDERHSSSLVSLLECDSPLRELNISCNHVGFQGFLQICQILNTNTHLEILNISSNNIKLRPGSTFPSFLDPMARLQVLDLRYNQIENKGGEIVLELLKTRKTLLQENRISVPLIIFVTERLSYEIFAKINEVNKWMEALTKKKKKSSAKGAKKKK